MPGSVKSGGRPTSSGGAWWARPASSVAGLDRPWTRSREARRCPPGLPAGPPPEAESRTEQEPVVCADGYVRRSPVQPYRRGDTRGRRRRIVLWVLTVILIVLLAAAIWRGGLLRL